MAIVRLLAVVGGKQKQIEVDFDQIGLPKVYEIELEAMDIANKNVTLDLAPINPTAVTLTWLGVQQRYGVDFTVSGTTLTFLTTFSDLLQVGDFITVQY